MPPKKNKPASGDPNGTHPAPKELQHSPYNYDASEPFEESYQGHCFCGTIQFSLSGDPLLNVFCHCRSCQRLHGAPSTLSSIYPKDRVHFTAGVSDLVFWSPQKRENGYLVPCKLTCGNCHSPIGNEGSRTMLMLPALIDFSKKYPHDKSKRDEVDAELPPDDQSGHAKDKDKKDDDDGQGRLPAAFRPDIHQHYETRIRDIQDDLPKFGKEKNKEPLNQAARDFMAKSEREKKEKEEEKKEKEEKEEKEEKDKNEDGKDDKKQATKDKTEKHEKTPPKNARSKRQKA